MDAYVYVENSCKSCCKALMAKSDLNKFFFSKKFPLNFNQKQRLKAEIRHEKAKEKSANRYREAKEAS